MKTHNLYVGILTLLSPKLKGIGPAFIHKNVVSLDFFEFDQISKIEKLLTLNKKVIPRQIIEEAWESSNELFDYCNQRGISIVSFLDSMYPMNLKEIKNSPPIIFTKGNLELLKNKTICIIGTREPNHNGQKISEKVMIHYKEKGWNICNGLAKGIDTSAIQENGNYYKNVIGVLGGGLDFEISKTLLKTTAEQAKHVLESGGLLISTYPPGYKENSFSVIASCDLQADLSDGLILIQSSMKGGSKFTISKFCILDRPFGVIDPVGSDKTLNSYSANVVLIQNEIYGLTEFTGIDESKIKTQKIVTIKSKSDYTILDDLIIGKSNFGRATLFD